MMMTSDPLLEAVHEIRELLRLIAEPAIAERDQKLRLELRRITGAGAKSKSAVQLMNGTRNQQAIIEQAAIDKGQLSRLVKQLAECQLLSGDLKLPNLNISIPSDFFDK